MKFSEKGFWKFFDKLTDVMAALAGAILLFICAAVCYTIGLRFLFTKTTIWIIPITEYALLWIVFLGTTWLLREKGHITTDILYTHLNEKTKRTSRLYHVYNWRACLCDDGLFWNCPHVGLYSKSGNGRKSYYYPEIGCFHHHPHRQYPPHHPVLQDGMEQIY